MLVYQVNCILFIQDYIKPFVGTHDRTGLCHWSEVSALDTELLYVLDTVLLICEIRGQFTVMCCGQTAVSYQLWSIIKLCKIIIIGEAL